MLCQMSKYFGKCFWLRCPSFLLSKFATQLKLIQSVVWVGILGICITSSTFRDLLSGFWVSGTHFQGPGCQGPGSQSPRVSGRRVSGLRLWALRCQGLKSQGLRSRVSGPYSGIDVIFDKKLSTCEKIRKL